MRHTALPIGQSGGCSVLSSGGCWVGRLDVASVDLLLSGDWLADGAAGMEVSRTTAGVREVFTIQAQSASPWLYLLTGRLFISVL